MDIIDNVKYLGQVNSGTCYPKRFEDINKSLPYFCLKKNNGYHGTQHKYLIDAFNYETHDNAPRMLYVLNYLQSNVFPFVNGDLSGYYNIQLHDTYTYLKDHIDYKDVLCFGKLKDEKGPVQLPDCYFLGDWGGKYHTWSVENNGGIDKMNWKDKISKIVFAGTTTGSRDPKINERINTCLWAVNKPECDFYITNIAQIEPKSILQEVPDFKYIYRPPIPMSEQMKYKYQLVIDGNTSRWNPDVYFTNTLAFHYPSRDMLWYFPLLRDKHEFVSVDKNNMINSFNYYENNQMESEFIIRNAKLMANSIFNSNSCQTYLVSLFESISRNK
jgi:hypothetical protein